MTRGDNPFTYRMYDCNNPAALNTFAIPEKCENKATEQEFDFSTQHADILKREEYVHYIKQING